MRTDYDKMVHDSGLKKHQVMEQWERNYGAIYRKKYDNYLILIIVCEAMFADPQCIQEDPWCDSMDVRNREFHEEFMLEIQKEIEGDIRKIKLWQMQKTQL